MRRTALLATVAMLLMSTAVMTQSPRRQLAGGHFHLLRLPDDNTSATLLGVGAGSESLAPAGGAPSLVPIPLPVLGTAVSLDGGFSHALAADPAGSVLAWGSNALGQMGTGLAIYQATMGAPVNPPVTVPGITGATEVAAGTYHSLALVAGTVFAWGGNAQSELGTGGIGGLVTVPTPTSLATGMGPVTAIRTFDDWSLALDGFLQVWTWGRDIRGLLGSPVLPFPTLVPGLGDIVLMDTGARHGLAVDDRSFILTWGSNVEGQLGGAPPAAPLPGNPTLRSFPSPVVPIAAAAGGYHNVLLGDDGTVWVWGNNQLGQLGLGDRVSRAAPQQVTGVDQIVDIAATATATFALRADGTLLGWGHLGSGVTLIPMVVPSAGTPLPSVTTQTTSACPLGGIPNLVVDQIPFLGNSAFRVYLQTPSPAPTALLFGSVGPAVVSSVNYGAAGNCLFLEPSSAGALVSQGLFPLALSGAELVVGGASPASTVATAVLPFYELPVPNVPGLASLTMTLQAAVPSPNTAGFALSSAVEIVIN